MASPATVGPPATLPADFDGWDKPKAASAPPQTLPGDFSGWDAPKAPAAPDFAAQPNPDNPQGTYSMWDTAGHKLQIPYGNVVAARDKGYKFDVNPDDSGMTPQARFNKDFQYDPANSGRTALAARPSWSRQAMAVIKHPLNSMEAAAQPTQRPANATMGEMAATDLSNVAAGATSVFRHPLRTAGQALEQIGGAVTAPVEEITTGTSLPRQDLEALPTMTPEQGAFTIGQGLATEGLVKGAPPVADAAKSAAADRNIPVVSKWARETSPAAGENFTPRQAKSHAAVIAEGAPGGDTGYIPRDIAQATGSKLRETAARKPEKVYAIRNGSPEDAYAAHQSILDDSKSEIDQRHEAALGTAQDAPVDMKPVQQAIQPTKYQLEGMDDADARAIQDLQQRAAQVQTLRGLNEFRKTLNNEDAALLKNPMGSGKSALYPQMVHRMANAVRDAYYDALEKATGQDFSADKRLEGNIIQEMRGALGSAPRLAINEAREAAPQSAGQIGADILEGGAHGTRPGVPIISAFADRLRGTRLGQIQQHLQRFYSDLPAPTVAAEPAAAPVPRGLPAPQRPALPASVIPNADIEGEPAGSAPPREPRFNVSPSGEVRPGPTPPPSPSIITPAPDEMRQLPARTAPTVTPEPVPVRALPATAGESAGPGELATHAPAPAEPEPTAPPLNPETAATRTRPPLAPNPQPTPPGRTVVTPEGTAIPERKALPAPVKAPRSGKTVGIGDTVSVNGRTGRVTGVNAKTGRIQVDWNAVGNPSRAGEGPAEEEVKQMSTEPQDKNKGTQPAVETLASEIKPPRMESRPPFLDGEPMPIHVYIHNGEQYIFPNGVTARRNGPFITYSAPDYAANGTAHPPLTGYPSGEMTFDREGRLVRDLGSFTEAERNEIRGHLGELMRRPIEDYGKVHYYRWGEPPESGRSRHVISGKYERGVSVYAARLNPINGHLVMDPSGLKFEHYGSAVSSDRPVYLMEGDKAGRGSDGEPLLRNARVVRRLHPVSTTEFVDTGVPIHTRKGDWQSVAHPEPDAIPEGNTPPSRFSKRTGR